MTLTLREVLARLADGEKLAEPDAEAAFGLLMEGEATPAQIAGLLMAMRLRGETVPEITGAARAMRARMLGVRAPAGAIDTCGTGGDASGTYNISTAASFIIAAAGVPVAKHGNRAASSKSGAADVLAALGVALDAPMERVQAALDQAGIAFLWAPRHHAAMRHVAGPRSELGTRTIFNLLGPLANPGRVTRQVVGVFAAHWVRPLAETLGRLGTERAWVVHGTDGLDELSTTGETLVAELRGGSVREFRVRPDEAGLKRANPVALKGGDATENAAALTALLDGEAGAYRDIAVLNAAAAFVVADRTPDLKSGAALAASTIDSGAARAKLAQLVAITNGAAA